MVFLKKRVAGVSAPVMERFVNKTCALLGLKGTVNVLVTTNAEMRGLNRQFRRKDATTDVLSFPAIPGLPGRLVGDVAISVELAAKNAKQLGHEVADEVKILILHGALHLAGYDHETDSGTMARKEARLRVALKLPPGLISRSELPGASTKKARRRTP